MGGRSLTPRSRPLIGQEVPIFRNFYQSTSFFEFNFFYPFFKKNSAGAGAGQAAARSPQPEGTIALPSLRFRCRRLKPCPPAVRRCCNHRRPSTLSYALARALAWCHPSRAGRSRHRHCTARHCGAVKLMDACLTGRAAPLQYALPPAHPTVPGVYPRGSSAPMP
jgi:hypothetical protein